MICSQWWWELHLFGIFHFLLIVSTPPPHSQLPADEEGRLLHQERVLSGCQCHVAWQGCTGQGGPPSSSVVEGEAMKRVVGRRLWSSVAAAWCSRVWLLHGVVECGCCMVWWSVAVAWDNLLCVLPIEARVEDSIAVT